MNHDCSVESAAGATLVAVRVRNDAPVARRVRVRNLLDGPVCPPRREGVPESGWDEDGYEGVVPAGGTVSVGYACPVEIDASDDAPPVAVDSLGRADDGDEAGDAVAEAVRSLGRARPPADAVPAPADAYTSCDDTELPRDGFDSARDAASDAAPDATEPTSDTPEFDTDATVPGAGTTDAGADAAGLPAPVASWLADVRTRIARAERLTGADAAEAAAVLESAGGYEGVSSLPDRVSADEEALRAFAARAERLADRAAAADAEPVVEGVGRVA